MVWNDILIRLTFKKNILIFLTESVKDFQRKLRRGLKGCEKKKKGCRLRTVRRQMVCFELEIVEPKCKDWKPGKNEKRDSVVMPREEQSIRRVL